MGIHGLLKHLGSGERASLATFAAQHYVKNGRPLRLAIDVAIWLFQIQAGQGGSNPALRTFYYRLLRLISLNIHPLFVFDGPNKPTFKRNKKVGGPGVRVATVPEFLAKQLLKQFGFPMHIAPGEAEAECALLQREGVVDAVLSEDVDTMMFGSKLTLRNWTAQGSNKTPSHIDVYRSSTVAAATGLDSHGMILVALMSGGDYIPEGIPGCGPTIAVAAAKAGYGKRLCSMAKHDTHLLAEWREELQMELRTNASKYFSRRNTSLVVPEEFPNFEVLGYYTDPCISSLQKVTSLRRSLQWDLPLDLPALRSFAGDAFDWHFRGGAIKFIRNLAPALLVREMRLAAETNADHDEYMQAASEQQLLQGVHNIREHAITDRAPEVRVSYIPAKLVPIDLSTEPVEDVNHNGGPHVEDDLLEADIDADDEVSQTPSRRKRTFRPYEEGDPERIWILREWVQLGCPAMLEEYEASLRVPKASAVSKSKSTGSRQTATSKGTAINGSMPQNALLRHMKVSKNVSSGAKHTDGGLPSSQSSDPNDLPELPAITAFRRPTTSTSSRSSSQVPRTPSRRKRKPEEKGTPGSGKSAITGYFSPATSKQMPQEVISLLSSSPTRSTQRDISHVRAIAETETRPRKAMRPAPERRFDTLQELPRNIASQMPQPRQRPRPAGLQKSLSMPMTNQIELDSTQQHDTVECLDLAESPAKLKMHTAPMAQSPLIEKQTIVANGFKKAREVLLPPKPKFAIKLRESLDGGWSTVVAETIDLSSTTSYGSKRNAADNSRDKAWRMSGVDTLDLTGT